MTISLLVLVPARNTSAERRASSTRIRVLAGEHHPFHFELGVGLGQVQNRAAGADFDVVAVGAEAKQTLHASQIQNR